MNAPEPAGRPPTLGPGFIDAIDWANELHQKQLRKGTSVPYVAHLLGVASLVLEAGGGETEAIAALLHDAVEDQDVTFADVEARCGARVAEIVAACTDDVDPTQPRDASSWRARKEQYIQHLETETDPSVFLVSGSDKLHNARSIVADLRLTPGRAWARFNAAPKDQLWYYSSLLAVMSPKLPDILRVELGAAVAEMIERTKLPAETEAWKLAHPDRSA